MKTILAVFTFFILTSISSHAQQWTPTNAPNGGGVTDMISLEDGTLIVTTGSYNWPGVQGGIRRSTDGGNSWQNVLNAYNARTLFTGPSGKIFASVWEYPANEGMYVSADGGLSWNQQFFGAANDNVFSIAAKNHDSMVFIGTRDGVYRNFNGGAWIQRNIGMAPNSWVRDIAIDSSGIIAAATTNGVYISTNQGNNWQPCTGIDPADTIVSLQFGTEFNQLAATERKVLYAGSDDGKLLKSFRENAFYTAFLLGSILLSGPVEMSSLDPFEERVNELQCLIASFYPRNSSSTGGVAVSKDGGATFSRINDGLPAPQNISKVIISGSSGDEIRLFCGYYNNTTSGALIFKTTFITGIEQTSSVIPENFSLQQNYPNPFNPSTKINFSLKTKERVLMKIYDETGKELETLVNESLTPGAYSVEWNAKSKSSGIYFCRMTAGSFMQSIRMILVK